VRSVRGTRPDPVVWTVETESPNWIRIDVTPSVFTLPDTSQTVTLDIQVTAYDGAPVGFWSFGEVKLEPDDPTIPDARLTIAVVPASIVDSTIFADGFESGDLSAWTLSAQ
jgi:hypothetical protein